MGCGSSSQVIPSAEATANGHGKANGVQANGNGRKPDEPDDLPTMVLPDTPMQPKAPIAFEIPLEEISTSRRPPATPPPRVQRLLQPPQTDITLPDIEDKLAEAEIRRQAILQQRAASAQKRTQKMMRTVHEMDKVESDQETVTEHEKIKHPSMNSLSIPPEPKASEDKSIY